jgi:hypothetical protein
MSVIILDAGNSIIKAKIARRERGEIAFSHAIKQLTEVEYTNAVSRAGVAGPPPGYLRINGIPYVVGESAERHGVHVQRTGAARYTRDYYDVQHDCHTIHTLRDVLLTHPFRVYPEHMPTFFAFTSPGGYLRVLRIHDLLAHFLLWNKSHPRTSFPAAFLWEFKLGRLNFW